MFYLQAMVTFDLLAYTIFLLSQIFRNSTTLHRNTHLYSLYIATITYLMSFLVSVQAIYRFHIDFYSQTLKKNRRGSNTLTKYLQNVAIHSKLSGSFFFLDIYMC